MLLRSPFVSVVTEESLLRRGAVWGTLLHGLSNSVETSLWTGICEPNFWIKEELWRIDVRMNSFIFRDDTYAIPNSGGRDDFDLTIEATFLSHGPFITLPDACLRPIKNLSSKPRQIGDYNFQVFKLVTNVHRRVLWVTSSLTQTGCDRVMCTLQLPLLVLWSLQLTRRRSASLTAATLSFVNALVFCSLFSARHHPPHSGPFSETG
jgi:hypothetical protein